MNVMHIDFFSHYRRQKQEEMKGFFRWRRRKRSVDLLMQAIYFPFSKNRAGWQQFWEVSITPCCNKALIWALDNVSAPRLCNTLNLAHLALGFLWFAVFRDTPLVTFLSHSLFKPFSCVNFYLHTTLLYNVRQERNLRTARFIGKTER